MVSMSVPIRRALACGVLSFLIALIAAVVLPKVGRLVSVGPSLRLDACANDIRQTYAAIEDYRRISEGRNPSSLARVHLVGNENVGFKRVNGTGVLCVYNPSAKDDDDLSPISVPLTV